MNQRFPHEATITAHTSIHRAVACVYLFAFIACQYTGIVLIPGEHIMSVQGITIMLADFTSLCGMSVYFVAAQELAILHANRRQEAWRIAHNYPRFA